MLKLRIFVSSPGDVGAERAVALAVAERLQLEFRGLVELETYLWERSVLRATDTFQAQILNIQDADLALFILWARIGTPLPIEQFARPDGSQYQSGTEYEFERAREGYEKDRKPEILCYLKTAEVRLSLKDREARARQNAELDAVGEFVDRWFRNPDGTFKSAFYNFEKPAQFEEQIEMHLRDWIRERLRTVLAIEQPRSLWEGSPFRGLQSFDFEHALIYCGRTAMVSEVLEALRRRGAAGQGFLMVTGMSGVGKSSLVRAGVLPLLTRPRVIEHVMGWRRAMFWPNVSHQGLLAGLGGALLAENALPELADETRPVEELLRDPPALNAAVGRALDRATKRARETTPEPDPESTVRLVILVDQFEEIFDETVAAQERDAFAEALRTLVVSGRVWVIATLRADFFSRSSELPERFRDLFVERGGIFTVSGPRPAEIAQMIRRPAMMAGLEFEKRGDPEEGLDEVLRDAASGNATVLPLLEFTLDELWRRSAGSGVLRFADYEQIGGLHGALRLRADEEFARLPAQVQAALPKVLAAIVHTDATDERLILQNRVSMSQFSDLPDCRRFIDAFVDAHLLVGDRASDGTPVIGLAHEALLREWPPAVQWIEQNRELLRLRAGISAAAALWRNSGQPESRLLLGALLKDAARLLGESPEMLAPDERSFVECSISEDRRLRRRLVRRAATAAAAIALIIFMATIGFNQIAYGISFARTIPAVWNGERRIPVSAAALANLRLSVESLDSFLRARAAERADRPELTAWSLAQMWLGLHPFTPSSAARAKELREAVTSTRDTGCNCWRETEDKLPHSMATAWVFYALAFYDQPATPEEIESLLARQGPAGWWAMYPATTDDKNASTSATAMTLVALHEQLARKLISPEQTARVVEAVRKGTDWLGRQALPGTARWNEYPPEQTFERVGDYLAVSGIAIHALRTVTGSTQFDRPWLDSLPQTVPRPDQSETSKGYVYRSKTQFTLDDVRHYRYPWMLRATIDSYANGSVSQKARAVLWIEAALGRPITAGDLHSEAWTSAEILFALRHAQAVLEAKSNPPTASMSK